MQQHAVQREMYGESYSFYTTRTKGGGWLGNACINIKNTSKASRKTRTEIKMSFRKPTKKVPASLLFAFGLGHTLDIESHKCAPSVLKLSFSEKRERAIQKIPYIYIILLISGLEGEYSIAGKCIINTKLRKSNCRLRTRGASPFLPLRRRNAGPSIAHTKEDCDWQRRRFYCRNEFCRMSSRGRLSFALFSLRYSFSRAYVTFY